MKEISMNRLASLLRAGALAALPFSAVAHEGHGAHGTHWHATDTWGFVVVLALVGATIWFSRKK
jgi:hypothetical protein